MKFASSVMGKQGLLDPFELKVRNVEETEDFFTSEPQRVFKMRCLSLPLSLPFLCCECKRGFMITYLKGKMGREREKERQ